MDNLMVGGWEFTKLDLESDVTFNRFATRSGVILFQDKLSKRVQVSCGHDLRGMIKRAKNGKGAGKAFESLYGDSVLEHVDIFYCCTSVSDPMAGVRQRILPVKRDLSIAFLGSLVDPKNESAYLTFILGVRKRRDDLYMRYWCHHIPGLDRRVNTLVNANKRKMNEASKES